MRRNVYEYEDVRNVHYNIAVPNITDEMFETLYAHETLYHDMTTMPRVANLCRRPVLGRTIARQGRTRHQLEWMRSQHNPGKDHQWVAPLNGRRFP